MSHGHARDSTTPTPEGFTPSQGRPPLRARSRSTSPCKLGFWLFLATEMMLFGGTVRRLLHLPRDVPGDLPGGSGSQTRLAAGRFNTVVLLVQLVHDGAGRCAPRSSAAQEADDDGYIAGADRDPGAGRSWCVKYFEYSAQVRHGLYPGSGSSIRTASTDFVDARALAVAEPVLHASTSR